MGMSFIGSYSGIDQATIDQLMEAERIPLNHMTRKKENIVEKQNAWKDINTRLNSLFEKMEALKKADSFDTKKAISSDDKYVSMTAGTKAAEGKYTINVEKLASNSSLVGKKATIGKDEDGKPAKIGGSGGTFTIKNADEGSTAAVIKVGPEDTLKDIVDSINNTTKDYKVNETDEKATKGTGISASIVDGRIVLTDENTGARNITVDAENDDVLSKIGLDNTGEWKDYDKDDATSGYGLKTGQKAEFTLNGIKIERDTNTINDAIEGVTINLSKVHDSGQTDTVTVSADTEKAAKLVKDFVDQYNSTMQFISDKTAGGDPEKPGSKGILAGESGLVRLQSSLRRAVTGILGDDNEGINTAHKIGITTTDKTGKLTFDKDKFLEALEGDKEGVMNFLNPKEGEGFIERVNKEIDLFISKKDGIIKSQNESFERTQKDLSKQIENFEARMVKKEAYYVKTFTALDVAMMKAEDQMGWLVGQIDSMNAGRR